MRRHFKHLAAVASLIAFASLAPAQPTTAPADDTPEQKAVRDVAVAFTTSLAEGSTDEALKHFAGGDADRKLTETIGGLSNKIIGFKKAIETKFGADAVKSLSGSEFDFKQQVDRIKRGKVAIDGESAVITTQGADGTMLRKVDGAWKVTALTTDPSGTTLMQGIMSAASDLIGTATKDINAGKYATVEDAKTGIQNQAMTTIMPKIRAAAMKRLTTSRPATEPKTPEPAPAPADAPAEAPMN
jgi:hypothetical protein